jgi:putative endonuclease
MNSKSPCVYILCNKPNGVIYVGVTSNLPNRIWQHKQKLMDGFCRRYNVDRLAWFEIHLEIVAAIEREKQIKKWNRSWKIELIEKHNPDWQDMYPDIVG